MRPLVAILLLTILLIAAFPGGANAGGPKEVAVGAAFGTGLGILGGGMALAFYSNPGGDRNLTTVLTTGGVIGFVGGIIFGIYLPDGTIDRDPTVSELNLDDHSVKFHLPSIKIESCAQTGKPAYFTDLFALNF